VRIHFEVFFNATPAEKTHSANVSLCYIAMRRLGGKILFGASTRGWVMSYQDILYEKQDKTVIITLNRPERLNAFTWVMGQEMRQALGESEQDPEWKLKVPGDMPEF
jgi:hypothetical protein